MIFGASHNPRHIVNTYLKLVDDIIEHVHTFKYPCAKFGAIRMNCVGRLTALTLYKSLLLPNFDYCDIIYMTEKTE